MQGKIGKVNMWLRGPYFNGSAKNKSNLDRFIESAKGVIDGLIIVANPLVVKPFYVPAFPQKRIIEIAERLASEGFNIEGVMIWPTATQDCVDNCHKLYRPIFDELRKNDFGVRADFDLEGKSNNDGWGSAGKIYAEELAKSFIDFCEPSVNFVVGNKGVRDQDLKMIHALNVNHFQRVGRIIKLSPQLYSQWNPKKKWTHNQVIRSGVFQQFGISKLQQSGLAGNLEPGMMVAFQAGHNDGFTGFDAVQRAVDTLLIQPFPYKANTITIWDSKISPSESYDWIRRLKQDHELKPYVYENENSVSAKERIKKTQRLLVSKGYQLKIDGGVGPITRAALEDYSKKSKKTLVQIQAEALRYF
jgi:hypothetical protein